MNKKLQSRESRGACTHISGIKSPSPGCHLPVICLTPVPLSYSQNPTCQDYLLSVSWCSWTSKSMDCGVCGLGPLPGRRNSRGQDPPLLLTTKCQQLATCLGHTCPTGQHCGPSWGRLGYIWVGEVGIPGDTMALPCSPLPRFSKQMWGWLQIISAIFYTMEWTAGWATIYQLYKFREHFHVSISLCISSWPNLFKLSLAAIPSAGSFAGRQWLWFNSWRAREETGAERSILWYSPPSAHVFSTGVYLATSA